MKVSLLVPLVSLPFFAACSPAIHNTDPLKNINQEEVTDRSFSADKNSEEFEDVKLKKVSGSPPLTKNTTAGRTVAKSMQRKGAGVQQAVVVYSSELVPIVEAEEEEIETDISEAEEIKATGKEPPSLPLLTALKQRGSSFSSSGEPIFAPLGVTIRDSPKNNTPIVSAGSLHLETKGRHSVGKIFLSSSLSKKKWELEDVPPLYIPVQSEQELKEELTALEKTGDWGDSGQGKQDALSSYGIQCDLPKSFVPVQINLDVDFLSSIAKRKDQVPPVELEQPKKAVCDFPVIINKQVEFYLDQFQNRQRTSFRHWLKRSALLFAVD